MPLHTIIGDTDIFNEFVPGKKCKRPVGEFHRSLVVVDIVMSRLRFRIHLYIPVIC